VSALRGWPGVPAPVGRRGVAHLRDHGAFQAGVLLLVACGAGTGLLCGLLWIERPDRLLIAAVGATALLAALRQTRNAARAPVVASAGLVVGNVAGVVAGIVAGVVVSIVAGLALAWLSWRGLAGQTWESWSAVAHTGAGALFGLVSGLGLLPAHLARSERDPVAAALAAARLRSSGHAEGEEWTLVQRAATAHRRIGAGLAGDRSPGVQELRTAAGGLTLQVIELGGRCRELREELGAVDPAEVAGRGSALAAAAGATEDEHAREDFARAARSTAELQDRLRSLRAAHDRLRARLSLQVSILESTAAALSTRRASSIAHAAASLTPLADRVREAGVDLETEALALAEAAG
jgi:hypothetical protein